MKIDLDRVAAALPGYDVGGVLGKGSWGVVLGATHRQLGRQVAIKELPRAFAVNAEVRARFVIEARALASLDHPHIVSVFDYVEEDGLCLFIMEHLSGGTLWERFSSSGVRMDDAFAITMATCTALQYAHDRNILHRDIKPENVMFSADEVLKVTDFGVAKMLGGAATLATVTGDILGTPAYMAPEQAESTKPTPATDVYAVATMLYELLSGTLPYPDDDDALKVLRTHANDPPRPLLEVADYVPEAVADVVMRSLDADPLRRHQSAEAFGVAVAEAATDFLEPGWMGNCSYRVVAAGEMVSLTERPRPSRSWLPAETATEQLQPVATEPSAPAPSSRPASDRIPSLPPSIPPPEIPSAPGTSFTLGPEPADPRARTTAPPAGSRASSEEIIELTSAPSPGQPADESAGADVPGWPEPARSVPATPLGEAQPEQGARRSFDPEATVQLPKVRPTGTGGTRTSSAPASIELTDVVPLADVLGRKQDER